MTEIARQGRCKILWNNKDVTSDISGYVSSVNYTDREEDMSDDATFIFDNSSGIWSEDWYPQEGDTIELFIGYQNSLINCGLFEVDEITLSGSPDEIEVKTIAAGVTKSLRTRNSKAFENQTLKQIAQFFCTKHGFTLVDTSNMLNQINLDRKTQDYKTDLGFLSELAKEYGFIFSIRGDKMVFISYYDLDNQDAIKDIDKTQVGSYSVTRKMNDTYAESEAKARNKKTGEIVKKTTKAVNLYGEVTSTDTIKSKGSAKSAAQAESRSNSNLWNKNKLKQTLSLNDIEGDPHLVSGINFNFTGVGLGSGKYHITSSSHTISGDGAYRMKVEARLTGTVPKPQRIPKQVTKKEDNTDEDQNINLGLEEDYYE